MFHKSLLLTGLAVLPTLSSVPVNVDTSQEVQVEENGVEDGESCTFMYVGKNVSESGCAIMARCGDSIPKGMNMHTQIFAHNQLANVTVHGKNGFSWKMPSTTYRYISTPRNPAVKNGLHWEVSAINENGVAVSATLTCSTNDAAKAADEFKEHTGITEDNIAQIVAATATSARNGIETIARIVADEDHGNAGSEAFMVMDKNEVWYMELYTGHQYLAMKMPDDKACTMGNEFSINTLAELDHLKEGDYIASAGLKSVADAAGFAKYDSSGHQSIEHLHLFNTYAGLKDKEAGTMNNRCHMRTWRGRNLYGKDAATKRYTVDGNLQPNEKLDQFWTPSRNLNVNDVIAFMRDRFENIVNDTENPDHKVFTDVADNEKDLGGLRVVGTDMTYQVHIISVDPTLPAQTSVTEWMALSSANYTPFIPFNSGMSKLNSYYSYVIPNYGLDEKAACCVFKKLNILADTNRTYYGLPIQNYIADHEDVWQKQYNQLISQIKTLSLSTQKDVLSNYCYFLQNVAITMSKVLFDDLTWHTAHLPTPKETATFYPLIRPDYYGYMYGWDYSVNNNIVTLKQDNDTIKIDCNYTDIPKTGWVIGKLTKNSEEPIDARIKVKDGVYYLDYEKAKTYLKGNHTLRGMNYKDFISTSSNDKSWVIPVAITVPIVVLAASVAPVMAFTSSKKKKIHIKK